MDQIRGNRLANALYDNYEKMSEERGEVFATVQNSYALDKYLTGKGSEGFIRENDARAAVESIDREAIAEFYANDLYDKATKDVAKTDFERELFYKIGMQEMFGATREEVIKNIADCMLGKTKEAYGVNSRLMMDFIAKEYEQYVFPKIAKEREDLARSVEKGVDPRFKVKNVNVNAPAVNYCRQEVLCGTQISIQNDIKARDPNRRPRREYNIDDVMMAVTDIGNKRSEQQDAVSILYHPSSKAYKMLVVADGMGGREHGDRASREIVRQMTIWFESLDPGYLKAGKEEELADMWDKKLLEINQGIIEDYPGSGSTFVGAIVGEKSTIVASVGDSRAYVVAQDDELYQVTSDDNNEFREWKMRWTGDEYIRKNNIQNPEELKAYEKDLLRFHVDSNKITAAMGVDRMPKPIIKFARFLNNSYKSLMLFSDGVTDCLSDAQLMAITKSTSPKDLAKAIVDKALTTESKLEDSKLGEWYNDYDLVIPAGKDNTTAAVYHNTDEGER